MTAKELVAQFSTPKWSCWKTFKPVRRVASGLPNTHRAKDADGCGHFVFIIGPSKTSELLGFDVAGLLSLLAPLQRVSPWSAVMATTYNGLDRDAPVLMKFYDFSRS